ncbi:transcriptional regulator with XRE-family HTH domain [Crossiella equi]|uniref:Transcriptional regulator with XRE-family HTH domain n=1 Tax=Crossiella equi TaxID=130796 RepID=A0ABS5A3H7_9PSEU|nr:helix-turn-helix domain-containing protein [Crossiella equi]MBP2471143.1 transcriptional regulator with XRE-family HTH domain [Crossiella equi]
MRVEPQRSFAEVLRTVLAENSGGDGSGRISNTELARAATVTPSYISQLARGMKDPSYAVVLNLAEALRIHPAYFVGGRRDRAHGTLPVRPFQDKLNALFSLRRQPGAAERSLDSVVEAVRSCGVEGWTISPNTISDLRSGRNLNPRLPHLVMLAAAFDVPPAYFLDDAVAAETEGELRTSQVLAEHGVDFVIARGPLLSAAARDRAFLAIARALNPSPEARQAFHDQGEG